MMRDARSTEDAEITDLPQFLFSPWFPVLPRALSFYEIGEFGHGSASFLEDRREALDWLVLREPREAPERNKLESLVPISTLSHTGRLGVLLFSSTPFSPS